MRSILTRISLLSFCLFLFFPAQTQAAPEKRIALVIGNGNYEASPLRNPVNDATDMATSLKKLGFNTGMSETPITPVVVGDAALAHQFSRELFAVGVFAQGIGYPTVPPGKARIRTIVTATHTREELARAVEIFESVGKKLKIV